MWWSARPAHSRPGCRRPPHLAGPEDERSNRAGPAASGREISAATGWSVIRAFSAWYFLNSPCWSHGELFAWVSGQVISTNRPPPLDQPAGARHCSRKTAGSRCPGRGRRAAGSRPIVGDVGHLVDGRLHAEGVTKPFTTKPFTREEGSKLF